MKKLILTTILSALFLAINTFQQEKTAEKLIVGTWVAEGESLSSRWIFKSNGECLMYDENEVLGTYIFKFSTTSPQCGIEVDTGPKEKYLSLTNKSNIKDKMCYLLDFVDDKKLSIIYLGGSDYEPMLFTRK